jgi:hypothetical protein
MKWIKKKDEELHFQNYDQYENRYEECDVVWAASFTLNNIVFIINELKISDNIVITKLTNAFWRFLNILGYDESQYEMDNALRELFSEKKITKEHAK